MLLIIVIGFVAGILAASRCVGRLEEPGSIQ